MSTAKTTKNPYPEKATRGEKVAALDAKRKPGKGQPPRSATMPEIAVTDGDTWSREKRRLIRLVGKCLDGETRSQVIKLLAHAPSNVEEMASACKISQPAISSHLSFLLSAGFVRVVRNGRFRMYSLTPSGSEVAATIRSITVVEDIEDEEGETIA